MTRALPLAFSLALLSAFMALPSCAGCPPNVQQLGVDLAGCAAGAVPGALTGLVQQTIGSLTNKPGTPSWSDWSSGPLLSQGVNVATCAVEAAVHDLAAQVPKTGQADPALIDGIILGVDWLNQHGAGMSLPDHVQAHVAARRARKSMMQLGPPYPVNFVMPTVAQRAIAIAGPPVLVDVEITSWCAIDLCDRGSCVCISQLMPGMAAFR